MDIIGLDGREYRWNPHLESRPKSNASKYHKLARQLLHDMYPMEIIHEELKLPGTKVGVSSKPLIADLYINNAKLMIEVQGEQHYKINAHFFPTTLDFKRAQQRDRLKKEWCQLNGIDLVELPYNESLDEWKSRINNRGEDQGSIGED